MTAHPQNTFTNTPPVKSQGSQSNNWC